jgi:hypothetical protein
MKAHIDCQRHRSHNEAAGTAFAPLNPAHLTHQAVPRALPWNWFSGFSLAGLAAVEALRLALAHWI